MGRSYTPIRLFSQECFRTPVSMYISLSLKRGNRGDKSIDSISLQSRWSSCRRLVQETKGIRLIDCSWFSDKLSDTKLVNEERGDKSISSSWLSWRRRYLKPVHDERGVRSMFLILLCPRLSRCRSVSELRGDRSISTISL